MTRKISGTNKKNVYKVTYNKSGIPKRIAEKWYNGDDQWQKMAITLKYAKNGYLKSSKTVYEDSTGWKGTNKNKCSVKQQKKLPKKITLYFYSSDDKKYLKNQVRKYNSKGLVTQYKFVPYEQTRTYKYTYKNGRITSVIMTEKYSDASYKYRYVFKYTKKKIGKVRYAKMINSLINDSETEMPWF